MEVNVLPETESRKKFEKTVKGIKKMLKKSKDKPVKRIEIKPSTSNPNTPLTRDRGVVYIGHIPHGFYEDQMRQYFKQFGKVTNARVARSKKNGKSKGYAFVEFQNKEVAEIVADTMNNYLMDKRLLKAEYIPPDKQRSTFFSGEKWIAGKKCPGIDNRNKAVKKHNRPITDKNWISDAKQQLKKLYVMKAKLRTMGIDYDFFQPCDIPEELADFQPYKDAQPPTPKKDGEVAGKKKKPSTGPVTKVSPSPKKNKKQKRKEKSMNKPVSPIVKPPKKKMENGKTGPSVRPLLTTKLDEVIVEKKSKKNKAKKSPEAAAAQITTSEILAAKVPAKVTKPKKSSRVSPLAASPKLKKKTGSSVRPLLATKLDDAIVEKKRPKNKAKKSPEAAATQITASKILAAIGPAKVTTSKKSSKVALLKSASPELKKKVRKAHKN